MEERILLVPMGVEARLLEPLAAELQKTFRREVRIGAPLNLPRQAYNRRRDQYSSALTLDWLNRRRVDQGNRLLGITGEDLYVPGLNFVFGQAQMGGRVALISLARLRPGFYGQPPNDRLLARRILIEAVHELGHTYGLGHCWNPDCVMHFSNSIADTDRKKPAFCLECRTKLVSSRPLP